MITDSIFAMNFATPGKPIRWGAAVLPYSAKDGGWLLPVGPNQINRVVTGATDAMLFAQRINELIQLNPRQALRLTKVAA